MQHRSSGVLIVCVVLIGQRGSAQLRDIDPTKLPQDAVATYAKVLPLEQYAQNWSDKWNYDVPKQDVAVGLGSALNQLVISSRTASDNHELQLLAGLVAHFAYNVDVKDSYDQAVHFLQQAALSDPSDVRSNWFLGVHQCQASEDNLGMERLLSVEDSHEWHQLPLSFWNSYVDCATVTLMPGHALRAIDHAMQLGSSAESMKSPLDIETKRYNRAMPCLPMEPMMHGQPIKKLMVFASPAACVEFHCLRMITGKRAYRM